MQEGDKIPFIGYEWRVLDIRGGSALIITEKVIESRPYHHTRTDTTWADSEIRRFLNGDFIGRFDPLDISRVIPTCNANPDNPWYGSKGGADTQDRLFLLSIEEAACKYFGDSSEILSNPGTQKYKYWFNRKDGENNLKRLTNGSWWLRSPGRNNRVAAYIHGLCYNQLDSSGGCVGINGNGITSHGGLRPALWLKI